jgi:hypothetical protein
MFIFHRSLAASAMAVSAALTIAGCGTPAASPGAQTPVRSAVPARLVQGSHVLCQEVPAVRRIAVHRVLEIPQSHLRFAFPATEQITSRESIQTVARALCALPQLTIVNCPVDLGVVYRLTFYPARLRLASVGIDAAGCGSVTGLGVPRRMATLQFWHILGSAIGLAGGPATVVRLLKGTLPGIAG